MRRGSEIEGPVSAERNDIRSRVLRRDGFRCVQCSADLKAD
jgi:hypothetical protein